MRYGIKITGSFSGSFKGEGAVFRLKKLLMLLGVIAWSLSLGISVTQAQDDPGLPVNIPQRCAAKYPERARQIKAKEQQANNDREEIRKAEYEVATRELQAEHWEQIARGLDERAKLAREKKNTTQAEEFENDAKKYRAQAEERRNEAAPYRQQSESLRRSVAAQQATIDQLFRQLLKDCGIKVDQGGGNQGGGGNTGGGNQGGGNQGGGNQGGGNQGGGNQGGGNQGGNNSGGSGGSGNAGGGGNGAGGAKPKPVNPNAGNSKPANAKPIDKTLYGEPIKIDLPNGGQRWIYKNEAGQVFKEELYDKTGRVAQYVVDKIYPNGQPAEDSSVSFGNTANYYGSIVRGVKYDQNGHLIETSEVTHFKNPPITRMESTKFEGGTTPTVKTVTTVDKNGNKLIQEYKDFDKNTGEPNTKIETEKGVTKTYTRDKDGNWVPKEDKKNEPPKTNPPKAQPPKPNPAPKPNEEKKKRQDGCLPDWKVGSRGLYRLERQRHRRDGIPRDL